MTVDPAARQRAILSAHRAVPRVDNLALTTNIHTRIVDHLIGLGWRPVESGRCDYCGDWEHIWLGHAAPCPRRAADVLEANALRGGPGTCSGLPASIHSRTGDTDVQ